jgi:uncharacterized protein
MYYFTKLKFSKLPGQLNFFWSYKFFLIGSGLILFLLLSSFNKAEAQETKFILKDVKFKSEGVTLSGTILKPNNSYAAIIIVHGSGQEERTTEFATHLAKNGITVLTYDKRGVGQSQGVYAGPEVGTNNIDSFNLTLLAKDASAATNKLKEHLSSENIPIGLLGFSQAGWIIPIAAKMNKDIRFMVLFSGPLITAREQLRFQFYTNGNIDFWKTHTEKEALYHIKNDPDKYQFIDTDPRETLSKLSIPGLWIFGGNDVQVPVNLSMEHLDALKALGKPYQYRIFPTLGHNTAFPNSAEPVKVAIQWIKTVGHQK